MKERGKREEGRGFKVKLAFSVFLLAFSLSASAQRPLIERLRNGQVRPGLGGGQRMMPPIIRRALNASLTLRFTGRRLVTVLREGRPDQHEEIVMRDGLRTRVEFPTDGPFAGQIIVDDEKERRHYLPGPNQVRVLPARREEGLQKLRALVRDGGITTEPGDRIAGYSTVEVTARDKAGNLLQRLAIEPESGMVLRRRIYDATGTEIGGFVFTKVDLSPAAFAPSMFKIERRGANVITPYDQLRTLAKQTGYPAASIPPSSGFRLDAVRQVKFPEGKVLAQNYVGPGGRVSLYELQAAVSPARLRRQGGRVLNTLSWMANGTTFVLVGPQDDATLARLRALIETR